MFDSIPALIACMESDLAKLTAGGGASGAGSGAGDRRRYFHATYLRTTRAVAEEIDRGGFLDGGWLERWDLAFAELYVDALTADLRGDPVSRPWQVAFAAAREHAELPPLRHVLLGMNAHINYDLPQALLAVISPEEFDDPGVRESRAADHRHVDDVLVSRVGAEDVELSATSQLSLLDRLLAPANRWATRRFLAEARAKVWQNTIILDRARRRSPEEYRRKLAELEELSARRLVDLTAPGQVLLKLARRGFGVRLTAT
jgi:hypothetical protein